ncbi:MAG: DUF2911 domain-containing protein [Bacteroidota bacterium]
MKNYLKLFTVAVLLPIISTTLHAQDVGGNTRVSQSRTTMANIGQCDITIKYHSPSVKGRKIFGGIITFNFVVDGVEYPWRTGLNERTTISFSHDVEIELRYLQDKGFNTTLNGYWRF